jgi:RHS repeat-associated protein
MTNVLTGETVTYQYDALNRLSTAASNDPQSGQTFSPWGQAFTYDGFGNLTSQTVTKGAAPQMALTVNPSTNRINGYTYDANGNQLVDGCTDCYDIENRLSPFGSVGYSPENKQVLQLLSEAGVEYTQFTFYGISGERLATYRLLKQSGSSGLLRADKFQESVYLGGRLIYQANDFVVTDRLASVVLRKNITTGVTQTFRYFPYGQEATPTPNARTKFATYYRDSSATLSGAPLDYADQRYYANQWGRFLSPDPYQASAGPGDPQSWNRYAYVRNDPVCLATVLGPLRRFNLAHPRKLMG